MVLILKVMQMPICRLGDKSLLFFPRKSFPIGFLSLFFFPPIQAIEIVPCTIQKASVEFVPVTGFIREGNHFPVALLIPAATLHCNPAVSKLEASISRGVVIQRDLIAETLRSKITMRTPTIKLRSRWLHLFVLQKEHSSSLAAGSG